MQQEIKSQITVEYPGGFSEPAESLDDAQARLMKSSHTAKIEVESEGKQGHHGKTISYREYRATGPDGKGWYFAGRIYISK